MSSNNNSTVYEDPTAAIPISYGRQTYVPGKTVKFKIILIGEGGVGKTSYVEKIVNGVYVKKYEATMGAVTTTVSVLVNNETYVVYEIWDTAGQEQKRGLGDCYYVGGSAAILFCDLKSRSTISRLPEYAREFENACGIENPLIVVAGNKIDAVTKPKQAIDAAKTYSGYFNSVFIDISIKTEYNYHLLLETVTKHLLSDNTLTVTPNFNLKDLTEVKNTFIPDDDKSAVDIANINIE